jgi:hypothetical protein
MGSTSPIAAKTNRSIGGSAPSIYLPRVQKNAGIDEPRLDDLLRTHLIPPASLRTDNFGAFFELRYQMLLERIAGAMGKTIIREAAEDIEDVEPVEFEDEQEQ